jgi:hypothetical protein
MIRARAAFQVCRYAAVNAQTDVTRQLDAPSEDPRQIYAEDEISEDVELGARMHAYGYKSTVVGERLATGEVWAHELGERHLHTQSKRRSRVSLHALLCRFPWTHAACGASAGAG